MHLLGTPVNKPVHTSKHPLVTDSSDKNHPFGGCANAHNPLPCSYRLCKQPIAYLEGGGCAYEERDQSARQLPEPLGAVDDTCGRHRTDDTRHRGVMVQYLRGPLGSATHCS